MAFAIQEISGENEKAIYSSRYANVIGSIAIFGEPTEPANRPKRTCAVDHDRDAFFFRLRQKTDPREGTRYIYALLIQGSHFIFEKVGYNKYKVLLASNDLPQEISHTLCTEAFAVGGKWVDGNTSDLNAVAPQFLYI